ncbi:MAG: hypothetical protein GY803_10180, partial [Chloroflexi bacterium]|nr:hypothetical protein [Chloroflexota bacterium]
MSHFAASQRGRRPHRVLSRLPRPRASLWPSHGFIDYVKILAQVGYIYAIAFPDRPEWRQQPYPPTICGVRQALITLCLRFAEERFPLAFSLDWLKRIIPGHNFDADDMAAIPIASWGVDVIADPLTYYPDSFKPPLNFLAWGYIQEMYCDDVEPELLPGCEHEMPLAPNWTIRHTAALARQAHLPSPLCYLAEAAEYVASATGNPWLDIDIDIYYDCFYDENLIEWSPENVLALKTQYEAALVIDKRIADLMGWVAEDRDNRMKQILA